MSSRPHRRLSLSLALSLIGAGSTAAAQPAEVAAPAVPPATESAEPAARRLSLGEALDLALAGSPDLAISAKSVAAADAHARATAALRLPRLQVEATALVWDSEQAIVFNPALAPLVAREQVTTTTTVRAVQPLTGLRAMTKLLASDRAAVTVARHEQAAAADQLAAGIAQTYLGVLLARAQVEIAGSRVSLVDAQLARARVLAEAGVLKRVDVLRLEAAHAGARREVILGQAAATSAAEALALLVGLPPGSAVDAIDDLAPAPRPPPIDAATAERGALANRDDLAAAGARVAQATAGASFARTLLLPTVNAIASYSHQTGGGPFALEDSAFVGVNLSWDVWDWGTKYRGYQEADHRAEQARLAAARQRDRARLEARKQVRDAGAAFEALAVARAGLTAAEEAYRIQEVRFAEGDTTTTELLQAESEQAQARLAALAARHSYFVQLAVLADATGVRPDVLFAKVR